MEKEKVENFDEVIPQDVVVGRAEKVIAKSKAEQAAKQGRRLAQYARQYHMTVPQYLEFVEWDRKTQEVQKKDNT